MRFVVVCAVAVAAAGCRCAGGGGDGGGGAAAGGGGAEQRAMTFGTNCFFCTVARDDAGDFSVKGGGWGESGK